MKAKGKAISELSSTNPFKALQLTRKVQHLMKQSINAIQKNEFQLHLHTFTNGKSQVLLQEEKSVTPGNQIVNG